MLEFLEQNPNLRSGKFTNEFTFKNAQQLWIQLANLLNATSGAKKEWKQWRKAWQDIKGSVKKKNTALKTVMSQTGGGPPDIGFLMAEVERVIEIVSRSFSDVTFDSNIGSATIDIVEADFTITENVQPLLLEHDYITQVANEPKENDKNKSFK